jgi:hypothetical protein
VKISTNLRDNIVFENLNNTTSGQRYPTRTEGHGQGPSVYWNSWLIPAKYDDAPWINIWRTVGCDVHNNNNNNNNKRTSVSLAPIHTHTHTHTWTRDGQQTVPEAASDTSNPECSNFQILLIHTYKLWFLARITQRTEMKWQEDVVTQHFVYEYLPW